MSGSKKIFIFELIEDELETDFPPKGFKVSKIIWLIDNNHISDILSNKQGGTAFKWEVKFSVYYCFLFLLFKMYQKVSNIELGGGCKGSPVNTNTHYRTKGTFPIAQANLKHDKSKEIIVSTHKIPGKVSPGKYKIYSQQTSRHGSVLENENSFI